MPHESTTLQWNSNPATVEPIEEFFFSDESFDDTDAVRNYPINPRGCDDGPADGTVDDGPALLQEIQERSIDEESVFYDSELELIQDF